MSELIQRRREQFRVDIRKQELEKEFQKKRIYEPPQLTASLSECQNLYVFEKQHKSEIITQINSLISEPCNENIQKLHVLVQQLSVQFSIYLIDSNIYQALQDSQVDLNLSLHLMQFLISEPAVPQHIFQEQTRVEKLAQFLNYLSHNLFDEHRKAYWDLMFHISQSSYTPFPFIKQIFYICCEELISCRNNTHQLQASILPMLITKYPAANQFFWESLMKQDKDSQRPWKAALHFLKQPNSNVQSCEQLILLIQQLMQYSRPSYYNMIVTVDLIKVLQSNLQRHERTLVRSLKCLQYIFDEDCRYAKIVVEDLFKLLQITNYDGRVEILRTLDIILRKEQQTTYFIEQHSLFQALFGILQEKASSTMNSLALQCIAYALAKCTDLQISFVTENQTYKSIIEKCAYDQHKTVSKNAEYLLDRYFDY